MPIYLRKIKKTIEFRFKFKKFNCVEKISLRYLI